MRPLIIVVFLFAYTASLAQTDSVKLSEKYFREGMEAYNFSHRKQAAELFTLAAKTDPKSVKAHLMAGKATMLTIHKEKSLPHFMRAYRLDNEADEDILFLIGQAYHYNEQFDSALWYYEKFNSVLMRSLQFSRVTKMNEVNWKIFECRNAQTFKANPVNVTIASLGPNINSEWPDYAPTISADESTMIFTTRRPENNNNPSLAEDLEYYEEIFISKRVNGEWQPAKKVNELNSDFHDASVSLSPDGTEMFVYGDENGGDIYETDLQSDGTWSNPKRLNGFINSPYLEISAAISADNKKLFFVSDRPDGYGGTDIYMALKNKRGEFTQVLNLGPVINTPRDEEDVFVAANGLHIYFSSNGHAGMGDLDIYRSTFDSTTMTWSEPLNLGYPINSVESDFYFVMTGDEKVAYISSLRADSRGEQDIYRLDLTNWQPVSRELLAAKAAAPVHQEVLAALPENTLTKKKTAAVTDWRIRVREENADKPVNASVTLIGNDKKEIALTSVGSGDYQVQLPNIGRSQYRLKVNAEGFNPFVMAVYVEGAAENSVIEETIFLQPVGKSPLSKLDLFYDTDQRKPQNESVLELAVALLKENPGARVNIEGHTDSNGADEYNRHLGQQRAEQAKKYLINAGIDPARVRVTSFGESKPLTSNATKAGRKFNRRTEIQFVHD